jgi:hypothetical protein
MAKLHERKQIVLETMRRLGRPIWAGDVARNAMEQELYRAAFRARWLIRERSCGGKEQRALAHITISTSDVCAQVRSSARYYINTELIGLASTSWHLHAAVRPLESHLLRFVCSALRVRGQPARTYGHLWASIALLGCRLQT